MYALQLVRVRHALLLHEKLLDLPPHARVPVVLDGVVRAPLEELGDLRPLVSEVLVLLHDDAVLLLAPRPLLDTGVQVVVPPLAALLPDAPRKLRRDHRPLLRAMLAHE